MDVIIFVIEMHVKLNGSLATKRKTNNGGNVDAAAADDDDN